MIARAMPQTGKNDFPRGLHPPDRKYLAADAAVEVLPPPGQVLVPLLQHLGAPNQATLKPRTEVAFGEVIGSSEAFVSAPVHASIAGKTGMQAMATLPNGRRVPGVPIKADGDQLAGRDLWNEIYGGDWPSRDLDQHTPEQILQSIREAGIVGLGGAAFPTHVKLTRNEKKPVDTLILNGCECEPYLTADYRLMLEAPGPIITGGLLAARAAGAERVILAIEDNKPAAIETMRQAADGTGIEVRSVHTRYPMGGERQLVFAVLGREVPTLGLPLDVGVVVGNVGTMAAIARAVIRGKPLTHRLVTVSGSGVVQPKNLLAPIGASYADLVAFCGGLRPDAARAVAGGPMMGFALGGLDVPVTKGTSGLVVLSEQDVRQAEQTACVRCGRCVDVCPLHLVPTKMAAAAKHEDWGLARRYHLMACCECGCCAYICPAGIPLAQLIRTGKAQMPRE